ncbi:hypothetical protein SCAR479_10296 [Seiridium cardinale]|uniref:C2H2-type domain-containing protein n=1 Tax=Seiridium cardinale TaxID=138064 RepID=A0ABR2XGN6_9PEZI
MNSKIASTSRGGSNQSTSQSFIDAYLARRKREEIQKLMEMLVEWIDTRASTTHASGAGSSSQPAASTRSSSSASSTPQKLAGQKRSLRRDSFDGSDPGRDGNGEDKRGNKRSRTGALPPPKLACPFFKREPGKYKDRQACTGPGYSSISRLKEHIYRAHKQPDNKCNRCCHIFSNADLLEEHQRAEEPCKVSKDNSVDGISESQYHQLRKKPAGPKSTSIAERWAEVYRIIFPKASVIPSCYYEYDDNKRVPECCDEELDLTEFIESELIEGVRNDLEDQFEDFTENTRRNFMDILKKRLSQIHQQLSAQRKKLQFNSAPDKAQQELSLLVDSTFPDIDFNDLLASSEFADFGSYLSDPIGGEVGYSSNQSDSAYYSMESPRSPLITS